MKRTLFVLSLLLVAHAALAQQVVTLHNAPQGVTKCTIPANLTVHTIGVLDPNGVQYCPFLEPQAHWKPGDGNPNPDPANTLVHDLSHAGHFGCNFPPVGEVSGPITVPCRIMLFHTAGAIKDAGSGILVGGDLVTSVKWDDPTTPTDGPLVGDPAGLKQWLLHITITPKPGLWPPNDNITTPVPPHGVFVFRMTYRTFFDNGDSQDTVPEFSLYSMLDPTQAEAPLPEIGTAIGTKNVAVSARDTESGTWGQNVVEVRDQCFPYFAPFSSPIACQVASYTYTPESSLTATYSILVDPDFHNGVPGTQLVFRSEPAAGGAINTDFLDPLVISQSKPPMGYPLDGTHKLCETWQEASDPIKPLTGVHGGIIAPGEIAIALLCHDVKIGPNPVGCTPTLCPPNPTPPPPPPPPPPPQTVSVPNVIGMTQAAATTALQQAGLIVGLVTLDHQGQTATVESESPAAGASVTLGSAVNMVVGAPPPPTITSTFQVISQPLNPGDPRCAGAVTGTSADGGKTFVIASGTMSCQ